MVWRHGHTLSLDAANQKAVDDTTLALAAYLLSSFKWTVNYVAFVAELAECGAELEILGPQ